MNETEEEDLNEIYQKNVKRQKELDAKIESLTNEIKSLKEMMQNDKKKPEETRTGKFCSKCKREFRESELSGDCPACGCKYYFTIPP